MEYCSGVQFTAGNLFYDFTTAQNKAYGNNLKLVNGKWCIYSGDVNQDGFIDINDQSQVFIDNINWRYRLYSNGLEWRFIYGNK